MSSAEARRGWGAMLRLAALRLATAGGLVAAAWLVGTATAHAAESPAHPGDARNPSGVTNPGQRLVDASTWADVPVPAPVADDLPKLGVPPTAATAPTGSGIWRLDSVPEDVTAHSPVETWLVAEPTPAAPGHAEPGVPCNHGSHGWHLHLPKSGAHVWSAIPSWMIARVPVQSLGLPIVLLGASPASTTAAPDAAAQPEPGTQAEPQVLSAPQTEDDTDETKDAEDDTAEPAEDERPAELPLLKLLTAVPPLLGGGSEPQGQPVLPVPVDVGEGGEGSDPQAPSRPVTPEEPAAGVPPHDEVLPTDPQVPVPGVEEPDTSAKVETSRSASSGRHVTSVKRVKKPAAASRAAAEKDLDHTSPERPLPEPKPHPAPISSSTSSLAHGEGGGLRVLVATPAYEPLMDHPSAIHAEWLDVARLTGVSTQRPMTSPD